MIVLKHYHGTNMIVIQILTDDNLDKDWQRFWSSVHCNIWRPGYYNLMINRKLKRDSGLHEILVKNDFSIISCYWRSSKYKPHQTNQILSCNLRFKIS